VFKWLCKDPKVDDIDELEALKSGVGGLLDIKKNGKQDEIKGENYY
jgi:hypothetical protein